VNPLRIGSRGSQLALWQARHVQQRLAELGATSEIRVIQTSGDRITHASLADFGGKGLFIKEIEEALLAGAIDCAVHSLKDVPSSLPAGLGLTAILTREDPRDALVAAPGVTFDNLPPGARLGTSSLRRQAQVLARRPDLAVLPLRGNVDTRLRKWEAGEFTAILLATAGLNRLQRTASVTQLLEPEHLCPAVGQGALALEARLHDAATCDRLAALEHPPTRLAIEAERATVRRLDVGCHAPVGVLGRIRDATLSLIAVVAMPDGSRIVRAALEFPTVRTISDAQAAGAALAVLLEERGAREILQAIYHPIQSPK